MLRRSPSPRSLCSKPMTTKITAETGERGRRTPDRWPEYDPRRESETPERVWHATPRAFERAGYENEHRNDARSRQEALNRPMTLNTEQAGSRSGKNETPTAVGSVVLLRV